MKDIAIYGAGGLGREIACLIHKINEVSPTWNLIGFFDDGYNSNQAISTYGKVLGGMKVLNSWQAKLAIVLAFGDPHTIAHVHSLIGNVNIYFPNLIYPNFWMADKESVRIGEGNVITGGCAFSCGVQVGNFNLFNGYVNLGHDVKVGSYNVFMPSVRISGEVVIGDENLFGVSSIVVQQLKIGNEITLGPGGVLLHKPKDKSLYIGNPARLFKY